MPAAEILHADPRLLHPLDHLRGIIRRFVLWDGLLAALTVVVAAFWLGLLFDYGLFRLTGFDLVQEIPWFFRAAALTFWVVIVLAILVLRIILRYRRDFSYPVLALVLEKRFPSLLQDRLINAVELADPAKAQRYGYSREMIEQTISEARERVVQVPVRAIFNWSRLWLKLFVLGVISLGLLAATFVGYAVLSGQADYGEFSWRFSDIVSIWTERHILLKNTPWPRQAYVELVGYPDGPQGLRIGTNARALRIAARAYQWLIVDPGSYHGWRPLKWSDLSSEMIADLPPETVLLEEPGDWTPTQQAEASLVGGVHLGRVTQPVTTKTVALREMTVDQVSYDYGTRSAELQPVFAKLDKLTAQPRMSRKLRKLERPEKLLLTYVGKPSETGSRTAGSTRGEVDLVAEASGDYSGEVINLKESVTFRVRAADFRTDPRDILLVPPPRLSKLELVQAQPAYLFHPAPVESVPEGTSAFALLKGLRQQLAPVSLTLTGDKSVSTVPVGTDLTISATADKPLQSVRLVPQKGKVPGKPIAGTTATTIPFQGTDFTLEFRGDWRIRETTEFELHLTDEDGVSSTRSILIQAQDDKAPQVELAVDVLRKVGPNYLCTPRARIPFIKESGTDDAAVLSRLDFEYTVIRLESTLVTGLQLKALPSIFAAMPDLNPWAAVFSGAVGTVAIKRLGQGEQRQFGSLPARPFERLYALLPKDTLATLQQKLATPIVDPDPRKRNIVREAKFKLEEDVLDLEVVDNQLAKSGARMAAASSSDLQSRFRLELSLVATDSNYETGPKQGRNLQPVVLLVVSEADLLAEISKDEEAAIAKLDEAIRKLKDAQTKLQQQLDRLSPPNPSGDVIVGARVRAEDLSQDAGKARDFVTVTLTEYTRLKRETEVNRCNPAVPRKYEQDIIKPLSEVLEREFQVADDAILAFKAPLIDGQRPDDLAQANARTAVAALLLKLNQIRDRLGQSLSESQLRDSIRLIAERQKELSDSYERIRRRVINELFAPKLLPVPEIVLNKKEERRVKQGVDWGVFDKDDLKLRIEAPAASRLRTPGDITIKTDTDDYEFVIQAGDVAGTFEVKITPAIGNPVSVKVTVK